MKPSLRISIFARDNYACQYCGRRAPNVELHVEHIISRKDGGADHPANLVTSCKDCNLGKGRRSVVVEELTKRAPQSDVSDMCFLDYVVPAEKPRSLLPDVITPRSDWSRMMAALSDAHYKAWRRECRNESIAAIDPWAGVNGFDEEYWREDMDRDADRGL